MGAGTSTTGRNGGGKGRGKQPTIRPNGWHGDGVSYANVPAELVHSIVSLVATAGGAVMFGQTRDGGAFSCMVLFGDEKIKEYPRDAEEYKLLLHWLAQEYIG